MIHATHDYGRSGVVGHFPGCTGEQVRRYLGLAPRGKTSWPVCKIADRILYGRN